MNIITNPKKKVTEFVVAIKQQVDANTNEHGDLTLYKFISDAFELIHYHEWGVALENLLDNLYEIEYPLNEQVIKLAKEAVLACKMDYSEWDCIEELRK